MNKLKKALITVGVSVAILGAYINTDYEYTRSYEILDDNTPAFASYCDGNIYIGDRRFLSSIYHSGLYQEGDIFVLDKRDYEPDPDMKVINSCIIDDKNIRNDIIEVLQIYEEMYPTDWDRTTESMRLEWYMHNLSYKFNYETSRTCDVDLDNDEEEKYDNKVLRKILKL